MTVLTIDKDNGLYFLHAPPVRPQAPTFVFVNALTGTTDHWEAVVAPALRTQGFGTLSYNFRGQSDSPYAPGMALTPNVIVDDIGRLVGALSPQRPVLVGLSIGGLFAAQAIRGGVEAAGLVFLNTIRKIGPRIAWVNGALAVFARTTGVQVMMDATLPMLVNPDFLTQVKPNCLQGRIDPLPADHPHMNLMAHAVEADWGFPWTSLNLPVLNITGLCDRVFLDKDIVEDVLGAMPDVRRLDWTDCGHLVPLERPERLARALADFGAELEHR